MTWRQVYSNHNYMSKRLILVINPGSTSTKFALVEEDVVLFEKTLRHSPDELSGFKRIADQFHYRKNLIIEELISGNFDMKLISAVIGRGGVVKPIESGIYEVNQKLRDDLSEAARGEHASNLGGLIAFDIAASLPGVGAYIVDPVVVDEMIPVARISGHPKIERVSIFHALNQKAVARLYASSVNKSYEELNIVVAHMGGGVSVGAHRQGRVVDVNNALHGDGPFSPERSGGLPARQLIDLCFSGKYTHDDLKSMITGQGGMLAYLGTNNFRQVCEMAEAGDEKAALITEALAYQIAKEIGSMAAVLEGKVDAIILTGGLAYQESHVERIRKRVEFIARVVVYPGEDEIRALAFNGLLALDGKIQIKTYA